HTPVPDYHLLSVKDYAFMSIQVSRGCPFNCDFCEITSLLGHKVRMQPAPKVIETLETLYQLNWRGPVSVVDDNFIGNKKEVKYHLLPAMKKWMQEHNYPFSFNIQSSINLADDDEMLTLMTETGFNSTFIGIETPDEDTLQACNKHQNEHRNLLESVKKIQQAGFNVSGGFIVGFDSDNETVFQRQADFIQKSGIVSAMVGLLNAPKNTQLYHRLKKENRLTVEATGNNTDSSMNFVPKMNFNDLISGYKSLIRNLYESRPFYQRTRQFMMNYRKNRVKNNNISIAQLRAVVRLILIIGILNKGRTEFWKFLFWTLFRRPALLVDALTFTAYGHHFRIIYGLDK
ncbi:MAG: B12-binding domain-containing radical SAM protein, partial [Sphingobacteriales bacterium]|nr:B12-binding domain-containing radical SAM protein [Sphingobacteriales bacterium]